MNAYQFAVALTAAFWVAVYFAAGAVLWTL